MATGTDCTLMQPCVVPITSTQIDEKTDTAVWTTQAHPCRKDCVGMNTKDEVQFTRSKILPFSPLFALKLQQEVVSGEDRGGGQPAGYDRRTLGREKEAERHRERKESGAVTDRGGAGGGERQSDR